MRALCRLGLHAWEPIIRSPDGVIERQNCRRLRCGVGRVLYLGVEVQRGRQWWFPAWALPRLEDPGERLR